MNRATFVSTSGALAIGFAMSGCSPASVSVPSKSEANPRGESLPSSIDAWLAVAPDGEVSLRFGKVELGTGVDTAIAQIVADELDVPVARVTIVTADTSVSPNQGYTAGSETLRSGSIPVRKAAAEARSVLLALAAQRWNVTAETLETRNGAVVERSTNGPGRSLSYGLLVGGRRFHHDVVHPVSLKPPSDYRVIGRSIPRVDIPAKIDGTHRYVQNLRVPGMLHGRVVRPTTIGAKPAKIDASAARRVRGFIRVVSQGSFIGVVAQTEWSAIQAARALRVTWSGGGLPAVTNLGDTVRAAENASTKAIVAVGDADAAGGDGAIRASYVWPFQSHGSIGPSCAVADVRHGSATIWSATQGVFPLRGAIAQLLGLPNRAVRVIYVEGAGCYGHNGADDAAADAALLSRAVGHPVRVQWMRSDEHQWDPKGPAMAIDMSAKLDQSRTRVAAWQSDVYTPTHATRPGGEAGNLLAGQLIDAPPPTPIYVGGDRDARVNYRFNAYRVTMHNQANAVLRQSAMRGLGGTQNSFANESFMDELAYAANADPIAFRLAHLAHDDHARAVIEAVARAAAWKSGRAAPIGSGGTHARGRGVAYVQYENTEAYVAANAQVTVDRPSGDVRVEHLWVAHDCGIIVNPDGLRNQIEGNAIQATSRAVKEAVQFDRRQVTSVDWDSYPILRFPEVPEVDIVLIDRPAERIKGAGEATTVVIAPAIANAVFAATGARVRSVPFTSERVRTALHSRAV